MYRLAQKISEPTPKAIKKLQKIALAVGGALTAISTVLAQYPNIGLPEWVPVALALGTSLNHVFLQSFTEEDNK